TPHPLREPARRDAGRVDRHPQGDPATPRLDPLGRRPAARAIDGRRDARRARRDRACGRGGRLMPKLGVNDVELFYQEIGPALADPLLLIMGWGGDHTAWAFQIPAFSAEFRVIAFDNRGAGQSDAPDVPYTIGAMADDAIALLDRLRVARAHVCGASMGGMIAQEIALRRPDRVLSLGLHCTLARPDFYGRFLVGTLLQVK